MFMRRDDVALGDNGDDLFGGTSRHVNQDPALAAGGGGEHAAAAAPGPATSPPPRASSPDATFSPATRRRRLLEQRQQQLARQRSRTQHAGMMSANNDLPRASTPLAASAKAPTVYTFGSSSRPASGGSLLNASGGGSSNPASPGMVTADGDWGSAPAGSASGPSSRVSKQGSGGGAGAGVIHVRGSGGSGGGGGEGEDEGGADARDLQDLLNDRRRGTGGGAATKEMSAVERELLAQGIAPAFDPVEHKAAPGPELDFGDMREFLTQPPPRGRTVQCYITRNKKGWSKMHPSYELRLSADDRFLMASKKRRANKTSNYLLSMDAADMEKGGPNYLGKVRSNFIGTEFVVYDHGANPKHAAAGDSSREELATVVYESNIMGTRGPRKMTVLLPETREDGSRVSFRPEGESDTMLAHFRGGNARGLSTMHNKEPKWNDQVGAFVLNFRGRVSMASVKNFQLVNKADDDTVLLQFGRVGKNTFTMDFQWPLTAVQAMGICMSSFDNKLACE